MKKLFACIVFLALAIALPAVSQAAPVGKFTYVKGGVDVTSPGQSARPVEVGDEVSVQDIVRTKSGAKAEVTFHDGNILRLAQNSRVKIDAYSVGEDGTDSLLRLFRGKVQNLVKSFFGRKRDRFEVRTPTAVCGVRGTDFFTYYQDGVSGAAFKEGRGYGYSVGRPADVKTIEAGQAMVVTSADIPPVVKPATDLEIGQHTEDTRREEEQGGGEGGEGGGAGGGAGTTTGVGGTTDILSGGAPPLGGSGGPSVPSTQIIPMGPVIPREIPLLPPPVEPGGPTIDGRIRGGLDGRVQKIAYDFSPSKVEENLKLWLEGTYETDPAQDWAAQVAGRTVQGSATGYFLGDMTGHLLDDGQFAAEIGTRFLGIRHLGTFQGDLKGDYGGGIWKGESLGTLTQQPLQYVSVFSDSVSKQMGGLLGGTESLWGEGSVPVTAMGLRDDQGRAVWAGAIYSHNYATGKDTTYETAPGAYRGYLSGVQSGTAGAGTYQIVPDYQGGQDITVTARIGNTGDMTAVGVEVRLPEGWTYVGTQGLNTPDNVKVSAAGNVEFVWFNIPEGPIDFTYTLRAPESATGSESITALVRYRGQGDEMIVALGPPGEILTGDVVAVYVDPYGKAGYLYGEGLEGTVDSQTGGFGLSGFLQKGTTTVDTGILPESMVGSTLSMDYPLPAIGNLTVGGAIDAGTSSMERMVGLETVSGGRTLSVWNVTSMGGIYANPQDLGSWSGMYGRTATIAGAAGTSPFYMLGDITGTDDFQGAVGIEGTLTSLDLAYLGTVALRYRGTYDPAGNFQAGGGGTYTLDPLAYSGFWGSEQTVGGSLLSNAHGTMTVVGAEFGLLGERLAPWDYRTSELFAMGSYVDTGGEQRYLWNTPVVAFDPDDYHSGLAGFTGGFWRKGTQSYGGDLEGLGVAIYMTREGGAGLLGTESGISGFHYDGPSMWSAQGIWTRNERVSVENPQTFHIFDGTMDAGFAGGFDGAGMILGGSESGYTSFFYSAADQTSLPFGIYNLRVGNDNTFEGAPGGQVQWSAAVGGRGRFDYESQEGYWLAEATGTWYEEQGEITGALAGTYLTRSHKGSLTGSFEGISDLGAGGSGTWIGQSLGAFEGEPLTFSANISQGYFLTDLWGMTKQGSLWGLLGGTGSFAVEGGAPLIGIGEYDKDNNGPLFGASIDGTYGADGSFVGFAGGRHWASGYSLPLSVVPDGIGELSGRMLALYGEPGAEIGFLTGDLVGTSHTALGMWHLSDQGSSVSASPDLNGRPVDGRIGGDVAGTITGLRSEHFMEDGAGFLWGLELVGFEGSFASNPAADWRGVFGGVEQDEGGPTYFLGDIRGTGVSPEGRFRATLTETMFLDRWFLGHFSGEMAGALSGSGWKAVALQQGTVTPLALSGTIGNGSFYRFVGGVEQQGTLEGLMGATSPFDYGTGPMAALGTYQGGETGLQFGAKVDGAFREGGKFLGFVGGQWGPDLVQGTYQDVPDPVPGHNMTVTAHIGSTQGITALGVEVQLPEGWTLATVENPSASVGGSTPPDNVKVLDNGRLEFVWFNLPSGPIDFSYSVSVPQDAGPDDWIAAQVRYRRLGEEIVEQMHSVDSFQGEVAGVFRDAEGNMGFVSGELYGAIESSIGMFQSEGGSFLTSSESLYGAGIYGRMTGGLEGACHFMKGSVLSPAGNPNAGLWLGLLEGDLGSAPTAGWSAKVGGTLWEEAVLNGERVPLEAFGLSGEAYDASYPSTVFFLGDMKGEAFSADTFAAQVDAVRFMDARYMGSFSGELLGVYSDGWWKGASLGSFTRDPLGFAAGFSAGDFYGRLGGTASLWEGSGVAATALGAYWGYETRATWLGPVHSQNAVTGLATTYEEKPGAFFGYLGGVQGPQQVLSGTGSYHVVPAYQAGGDARVHARIGNPGDLTALGMEVNLPEGWTLSYSSQPADAFAGPHPPDNVKVLANGDLELVWYNIPEGAIDFDYRLKVSEGAGSEAPLTAQIRYRTLDGEMVEVLGAPDMEGGLVALYVDPDGGVGYLKSEQWNGSLYGQLGMFEMDGILKRAPMGQTGQDPASLADALIYPDYPLPVFGTVEAGGSMGPGDSYSTMLAALKTDDGKRVLGVWGVETQYGSYTNPGNRTSWSQVYGQSGWGMTPDGLSTPVYQLGDVWGTDDLQGRTRMVGTLTSLDLSYLGTMDLSYGGTYDASGVYGSVGQGTYTLDRLAFSAMLTDGAFFGYSEGIQPYGSLDGILGGTAPLLVGTPSFLALGSFSGGDGGAFFGGRLEGTFDKDGVFKGFTAGAWGAGAPNDVDGKVVAVYRQADGSVGFLSGGYEGRYHAGLSLWELLRDRSTLESSVGLPTGTIDARIGGGLKGSLTGMTGWTTAMAKGGEPHWGERIGLVEGSWESNPQSEWWGMIGGVETDGQAPAYFLGEIYGSAVSDDGEFSAHLCNVTYLNPFVMGRFRGDWVGYSTGQGAKMAGFGLWEQEALAHVSGLSAYISDYHGVSGALAGYVGGTQSVWSQGYGEVYALGKITHQGSGSIWQSELRSENLDTGKDTTRESVPGAYRGWTFGTHNQPDGVTAYHEVAQGQSATQGTVTAQIEGTTGVTAVAVTVELPAGWTLSFSIHPSEAVGGTNPPDNVKITADGKVEFVWLNVPQGKMDFTYAVQAEGGVFGGMPAAFVQYRRAGGEMVATMVPFGTPERKALLEGQMVALYVDPDRKAGFLLSDDLAAEVDGDVEMFQMEGTIRLEEMAESVEVAPEALATSLVYQSTVTGSGTGRFEGGGDIRVETQQDESLSIAGQDWGIWRSTQTGTYTGPSSDNWSAVLTRQGQSLSRWSLAEGSRWSVEERTLEAKVAGAWVSWQDAVTGVAGGKLKGTFDADRFTWEAVAGGGWLETRRFLEMAGKIPGTANLKALEALDIPCVEIGRASLAGSSEVMQVRMNDVTFFAYSTGARGQIWATPDVSGTFSATPNIGHTVGLSGGGLNADFAVQRWDSNVWGAGVDGSGVLNRTDVGGTTNVQFQGAAAGQYMGTDSGSFSGTGSGVVTTSSGQ